MQPAAAIMRCALGLLLWWPLCSAFAQSTSATAKVTAEIASPAIVSVTTAAGMILGTDPGVLTLHIPGPPPAATIGLTATATDSGSGAIVFSAPRASAGALQRLVAAVTATARVAGARGAASGLTTRGVLHGQGVRVVVTEASQGPDGGGTVTAIISYD